MMKFHNKKRGFTLIELLVVIAIVGLLASTVLATLQNARVEARDARIISDIKQLQIALELFRNANGGLYPCNPPSGPGDNPNVSDLNTGCRDIRPYLPVIPSNPHAQFTGNNDYLYLNRDASRNSYTILVRMAQNASWCSVNKGPGHASWNGDPSDGSSTNYPPCY